MKKLILLIIVACGSLTTGCWNYKDLNDIAIVASMAIDKVGDNYIVTVQVLNAKKETDVSDPEKSKVSVFEGSGKTVFSAVRNIILDCPKKLYFSHLELLVIQEKIAKTGIGDIADFVLRKPETSKQFLMLVSREKTASEILKIYTPLETLPTKKLVTGLITSSNNQGITNVVSFDEFIAYLYKDGINPVSPSIKITGNEKKGENSANVNSADTKTKLILDTLGVFKKDKLVGWLNDDESKGFNFITNNIKSAIIDIPCNGKKQYIAIEVNNNNTSIKPNIKGNKIKMNISLKVIGTIGEVNCKMNLEDMKNIEKIKKETNEAIKKLVEKTIKATQKVYKSDILGFGQAIYKTSPHYWKKIKKDWNSVTYPKIDYQVKVTTAICKKGSLIKAVN